jgi:hypothetical protein
MEEKSPFFIVGIVGVVALVGIFIMISNSPAGIGDSGVSITGNVISDGSRQNVDLSGFGRVLFVSLMIGAAIYLYYHHD